MPSVDAIIGEGPSQPDPIEEVWSWRLIGPTIPDMSHGHWIAQILGEPDPVFLSSAIEEGDLYLKIPGIRPKMHGIIQFRYNGPAEVDEDCLTYMVTGVHAANDQNDDEMVRRWENECDCALIISSINPEDVAHHYRQLGLDRSTRNPYDRVQQWEPTDIRPRPPIWPRRYGGPGEPTALTPDQVDMIRRRAEEIQRQEAERRIDFEEFRRMFGNTDELGGHGPRSLN